MPDHPDGEIQTHYVKAEDHSHPEQTDGGVRDPWKSQAQQAHPVLGWPSGPCCTYSQRSCTQLHQLLCHLGGLALPETEDGSPHVSILSTWQQKWWTELSSCKEIQQQSNMVTFLWMGSAQWVAHELFTGLFGAAQFRVPSIKRDPRLSILISLYMVTFNK